MNNPTCHRCSGSMEPGFVVDHTYGAVATSIWASGNPEYSGWAGMKMKGRQCYNVLTYRCMRCGLLQSYAQDRSEEDLA